VFIEGGKQRLFQYALKTALRRVSRKVWRKQNWRSFMDVFTYQQS